MKRFHAHIHVDELARNIAREQFHTLDGFPVFRQQGLADTSTGACR